jgi:hypothetical protein
MNYISDFSQSFPVPLVSPVVLQLMYTSAFTVAFLCRCWNLAADAKKMANPTAEQNPEVGLYER